MNGKCGFWPFVSALAAFASLTGSGLAQDIDEGSEIFLDYCATCHGEDASGAGVMSEILTVLPPDLTGLAAANDGAFPVIRVVQQIDGRDPMLAHGGVMPLFGEYFDGQGVAIRAETGQTILTSQPIADLTAYLQSIQK